MRCAEVRELLPVYASDRDASLPLRRHLAACPDCRSLLGTYEQLLESLADLRAVGPEPPAAVVERLLAIPAAQSRLDLMRRHVARNRRVYAGGAALALTGAAAVWLGRRHRLAAA